MESWLGASTVVSAAATLIMAVYSIKLWRENRQLVLVQSDANKSNNAILEYEQIGLIGPERGTEHGIMFRIYNSGLKDTHIADCFLKHTGPAGPERAKLEFWWHKRDYRDHKMGNDLYTAPVPFHFIGERLESGQLWEIEARPAEDRGIQSYRNPCIVVKPVLGGSIERPIETP